MAETVDDRISWARRLRSAVLLILMVTVLGAVAAGLIGAVVVVGTSVLDQALG